MNSDHTNWFPSPAYGQENSDMFPPPSYPVHLSAHPNMSQDYDYTSYASYSSVSGTNLNDTDGVGDHEIQEDDEVEEVGEEDFRGRRLSWTEEDNIKLISAWLNNSIDPVDGNNKKGEVYWKNVTADYNKNSAASRKRNIKNCKDHWGKTNKKVVCFHGIHCRLKDAYSSGRCDLQLMDKALAMYKKETGSNFNLVYWWDKVKIHQKWSRTYHEVTSRDNGTIHIRIEEEDRPMGKHKAEARKKNKEKAVQFSDDTISHDEVKLYHEAQALRAEFAKTKQRTKMASDYKDLVLADTSSMDSQQRKDHARALKHFSD